MGSFIDIVAGARPNFMKVAPVLRALKARGGSATARLIHTGQHYDEGMSDVFFRQLGMPAPDVHLGAGSGTHGEQTAKILSSFERHLLSGEARPRGVVVVGDVNSTIACSLAAVKLGIPVAHVEAGLRSYDRTMPEEINRLVTDAIADVLLVSEPAGIANLKKEGIPDSRIRFVGNLMIDSLVHQLESAKALDYPGKIGLGKESYALVTLHRPSNVDEPERLKALVDFLLKIGESVRVVFPMHPRTREKLKQFDLENRLQQTGRVKVLETLGYRENLSLMVGSRLVLTDSGGIQEETTYLGIPCLTLRSNTERPVTVTLGTNTVVGNDLPRAEALVGDILNGRYKKGGAVEGWDGRAGERVATALSEFWSL
jgi:UDP-N-acetylglucosamine 2-epimerase (non-hydrolysing)